MLLVISAVFIFDVEQSFACKETSYVEVSNNYKW